MDWDEPHHPVSSWLPGPGSEIDPSQPHFDREPQSAEGFESRRRALASHLSWEPFHETEE